MKNEYKDKIADIFSLPINDVGLERILNLVIVKEVPAGTILLSEGDIATKLFIIIKGCLRTYFIKENGNEITSQFIIEGQIVSSFESLITVTPSRKYIEAIENSTVGIIQMKNLKKMVMIDMTAINNFNKFLISQLIYYMNLHASFILDNPEKRYIKLIHEKPELVSRIPQQYIASYLGITPVSLSRIKTRLKKRINNC
jgi:CRP-like cAMP-binding protein